jgi:hypothetical protein
MGKKTFANYISDKGLTTRTDRQLKKTTSQSINNPLSKWANSGKKYKWPINI